METIDGTWKEERREQERSQDMDNQDYVSFISENKAQSTVKDESKENRIGSAAQDEIPFDFLDADEFISIEYTGTSKELSENAYLMPDVGKPSTTVLSAVGASISIPEEIDSLSPASPECLSECIVGITEDLNTGDANDLVIIAGGDEVIEISDDEGENLPELEREEAKIISKTKDKSDWGSPSCGMSPDNPKKNESLHKRKICQATKDSDQSHDRTKRMKVGDEASIHNEGLQPEHVTTNNANSEMSKLLERELAEKMIQRMLERKMATDNLRRLKDAEVALARQLVRQIMRPSEVSSSKPSVPPTPTNRAQAPVDELNSKQRNQAETALARQVIQQLEKEDVTSFLRQGSNHHSDNGRLDKPADQTNSKRAVLADVPLPVIHRALKGNSNSVLSSCLQKEIGTVRTSVPQCSVRPSYLVNPSSADLEGDLVIEERRVHWSNHPCMNPPRPPGSMVHPSYVLPPTYREAVSMKTSANATTPLSPGRYDRLLQGVAGQCTKNCRDYYISSTFQPNHSSQISLISNEHSPNHDRGFHPPGSPILSNPSNPGVSLGNVRPPNSRSSLLEAIRAEELSLRNLMYQLQRKLEMLRWLGHETLRRETTLAVPTSTPEREDKKSETVDNSEGQTTNDQKKYDADNQIVH